MLAISEQLVAPELNGAFFLRRYAVQWNLQVDDDGKVELPTELARLILSREGVKSKKRRIQKKVIKRFFLRLIKDFVDSQVKSR